VIVLPHYSVAAPSRSIVPGRFLAGLSLAVVLWSSPLRTTLQAQDEHKKVPVIDKITSGGPSQQAFMGVVKSVDLESEVLDVDNITGKSTEIFPLKKKVHVVTADGDKLKLATLKPGTNVLVYFDQKGDHRTITRIVVLAGGPPKKKVPPS
jgi:Cu/Ag efflux protein CusF